MIGILVIVYGIVLIPLWGMDPRPRNQQAHHRAEAVRSKQLVD